MNQIREPFCHGYSGNHNNQMVKVLDDCGHGPDMDQGLEETGDAQWSSLLKSDLLYILACLCTDVTFHPPLLLKNEF